MIATTLGGIGLFLLGMMLMTEGLRTLAGDALRRQLIRFTRTPYSGAATGAVCTALLQSSSATTVAAVGFVGAGLMSFHNALGIIFGANIGTTITGWLVALIGFKLKLKVLALPLVLFGVLMRLFGRGRIRATGTAVAGFALVFIGIAIMQDGMRGLEHALPLDQLPGDTFGARLRLVAVGMLFTIITQSSSAAVAATLTLVNAGMIDMGQGAALVIGADIGTTVTAGLATIGAPTDARRTGLSHVIYNVMTGLLAMALVTPYLAYVLPLVPAAMADNPEFTLVAFHTGFNVLGVLIVLPLTRPFARLVERLVPAGGDDPAAMLDKRVLAEPTLALHTLHRSVQASCEPLLRYVDDCLRFGPQTADSALPQIEQSLTSCQDYAADIDLRGTSDGGWARQVALIHALDHCQRLHERLEEEPDRAHTVHQSHALRVERERFLRALTEIITALAARRADRARDSAAALDQWLAAAAGPFREKTAQAIAARDIDIETGTARLEAIRWLRRVGRHVARITFHLEIAAGAAGK